MKRNIGKTGKFTIDMVELENRARVIRKANPHKFSVRKLANELKCSNHNSSIVYHRILRGG